MREQYVKPMLYVESFSFTQTIAKNCGDTHTSTLGQSNHYDAYTCEWDAGDHKIFFDHCTDEQIPMPEEGEDIDDYLEGMCYNNPGGGQEIFSST